tara:strand:- start:162 stop:368 length:207 start_codon:yes stop_codon:yes gene_type:complete
MIKIVSIICLILTTGCTAVQPWERGNLAKQEMALDPDGMQSAFKNHVYFSKEASSGGNSTSGGGCGCN